MGQSKANQDVSFQEGYLLFWGDPDSKLKQNAEAGWNVTETCQGNGELR